MRMIKPFSPIGDTVNLAVTASAQDLSLPLVDNSYSLMLTVVGTDPVFIKFNGTATVNNGFPVLGNSQVIIARPGPMVNSASVISSGTASKLYVTAGAGV